MAVAWQPAARPTTTSVSLGPCRDHHHSTVVRCKNWGCCRSCVPMCFYRVVVVKICLWLHLSSFFTHWGISIYLSDDSDLILATVVSILNYLTQEKPEWERNINKKTQNYNGWRTQQHTLPSPQTHIYLPRQEPGIRLEMTQQQTHQNGHDRPSPSPMATRHPQKRR